MTELESSKINAYNSISDVFVTQAKKLELIPALAQVIPKFQTLLKELNQLVSLETVPKSDPQIRKQKHETLAKKICAINQAILISANLKKEGVQSEFHLSRSRMTLKKGSDLVLEATRTIREVKLREKQIVPALVPQKSIADLEKARNDYMELITASKATVAKRVNMNKAFRLKMGELDKHLRDQVDPIMQLLKDENITLFNLYKTARKVNRRTYAAKALFSDDIQANTTQTIAVLGNQQHNWLLIKNKANTHLSVFLSMIKDVALGEGITIPPQSTICRQVKDLHADERAKYLIAKNDDKKEQAALEIWIGG